MQRLSAKQVTDVINACEGIRDKAMLALVYQCGLRRGEVGLLARGHYSSVDGTLLVTRWKTRWQHRIELWARTKKLLDEYLQSRDDISPFLFKSRKQGRMSGQGVYYVYRNAANAAGLPPDLHHPHCLRHSIAAHLAEAGLDIVAIQKHLGHADPEGTVMYMANSISPILYNTRAAEASWNVARY